uniref:Piezo-type mechanosensitive ion channel component n=1 Tax=Scophthalmus maximus TaxID=52904 RepID=A0A8D3DGT2_SCOMX
MFTPTRQTGSAMHRSWLRTADRCGAATWGRRVFSTTESSHLHSVTCVSQSAPQEEEEKLSLDDNILLEEDFEAGYEAEEDEDEDDEEYIMSNITLVRYWSNSPLDFTSSVPASAGVMLPSMTSAVYFFIFLFLCTWWSLCRTFDTLIFSCMCVLMAIFSAGHLIILYLYQFQFFQEAIPPGDGYISAFGISPIVQSNCSYTWKLMVHPERKWYHFVSPIMLLILYYTLATLIRLWLQEPIEQLTVRKAHCDIRLFKCRKKKSWTGVKEKQPLIYFIHHMYMYMYVSPQAWSITYVSWLTFVFLMWSCMLWMVRDRRRYAMVSSPFMVAYGNLLIVLQYIWSFEDMPEVPGFFVKKRNPFHSLSSKVWEPRGFFFLSHFLHLIRRSVHQFSDSLLCFIEEEESEERGEQDIMQVLGNMVMALLVKYWIYICGGMFFIVSFEGTIVMYKIIYMMMFLSCVALYQVHYEWWRRILKYFWMSVVMYTMLVLTLVYTFQFKGSVEFWSNMLGMDKQSLKDLGLEQFTVAKLFTRIFIPTSFLLVCILHLHYFHDRFLQLTDLQAVVAKEESTIYREREEPQQQQPQHQQQEEEVEEEEEEQGGWETEKKQWHLVVDRLTVLFLKFLEYFHKLQLFIWWLLEIHIIKIVSCYIVLVSVKEVTLFNYVFLASWAFALPYSQYRPLASSVCTVWTCVVIVCKMLYQLKSIHPPSYSRNCSLVSTFSNRFSTRLQESLLYEGPLDPTNWVGLDKSDDLLGYLRNNLLMLALLAFEVTIYRHQGYFRLRNKLSPPAARIIFHDITRQHLDTGIVSFIKYFINYFFYKFGLETCLLLVVNVIGQRMDFYAMLHGFALIAVMYRRRRKAIAEIWPKYCCFLACMLTVQYFVCIGIPPAACKDYPWRFPSSFTDSNVVKWLYIPDFRSRPNSSFLVYDFMLLLCASLQRQVFDDENKAAVRIMAGDNVEICRDLDAASFSVHNPVPDFIHSRSYLDMLKVIMFSYLFWFVLTIIFITGTTRISVFCMGYLVACFYFLLFGGDLLLKPIKKILHYWDFLIAYNIFVITMKNVLSILACGYINTLIEKQCWAIQLLSLACTINGYNINTDQEHLAPDQRCELPSNEAGIIWDSICFAFLLLQRRVFMSYYFLHVVADIRASQILACRYTPELCSSRDAASGRVTGRTLVQGDALHISGDYYLFETDSEEEEEEEEKKDDEPPKKSAFQFCYFASFFYCLLKSLSRGLIEVCSPPPDNIIKRVFNIIKFTWVLFQTTVESFTRWMNDMCREYIDISTVLRIERCMLTREHVPWESQELDDSPPEDGPWSEPPRGRDGEDGEGLRGEEAAEELAEPTSQVRRGAPWESFGADEGSSLRAEEATMFYDEELEQSDKFYNGQPLILQLCYALYNMLVAHSEMVCYLVIIINHMVSASCATLVLPISIFLWAMLSVPRPSKRYWMTAIVYTEATIVIKYFFQFGFFPFNQNKIDKNKPYHPPNIIGVEKKDGYVHYDLVQLLALFFHRSILKCHGLWDEDDHQDKREPPRQSESEDEGRDREESEREPEGASSLISERMGSTNTLRSINFGTSVDSGHVQVHLPQQQTYQRRKSSSGGSHISHRSLHSAARSKRGKKTTAQDSPGFILIASLLIPVLCRFMEIYIPIRQFFYNLIHPEYSAVTDVYVLMFLADTVDFIIIVFGFWAFGKHSAADITSSLSEDQVPGPFLVMVLIQFGTMVVDRALYLRKSVMGKVIFQVFLVFGIHFWMFFILPGVTMKRFSENIVAQMWYFVKCIYFGLSAYQIRCGYPTRVLGNFLTKSYNYVNLFLFQGFRLVPFLTELRAVMDWVWTDTSLSLSSWICVEDIYAHIFILKCWRESEKRYPQPRGQKKKKVVKYGMGGMIVMLLICIVWFPLLFMSLVKSVGGVINKPLDVTFEITLAGFQPIFTMSAQQKQLQNMTAEEFAKFTKKYFALQWLESYMPDDLIVAQLKGSSNSLWTISPPSRKNLIEMLDSAEEFPITVTWTVQRYATTKLFPSFLFTVLYVLCVMYIFSPPCSILTNIFPRYIRAPSDSDAKPVMQFYKDEVMMDINLTLKRPKSVSNQSQEWWIVNQTELGPIEKRSPKNMYEAGLELYVFSDQVSPPSLGFLAGYGIMGLYASVVLVIGKFVREFFSGISHTIMFEELPNVDRILKLCTDIFLVRETGELDLEEDMYAKLIFLYRSPETMIKWTREKTQ